MLPTRVSHLLDIAKKAGLDAIAFNPGPSLTYLSGLHLGIMERPMILVITTDAKAALVLPELEMLKTKGLPFQTEVFPYGDNPATWGKSFRQASQALGLDGKKIGLEPNHMRVLELRYLEAAAPKAQFVAATESLAALRMQKDPNEITSMRKAVKLAQVALKATIPSIKTNVTEREIAAELTLQLLHTGLPFHRLFPAVLTAPTRMPVQLTVNWPSAICWSSIGGQWLMDTCLT